MINTIFLAAAAPDGSLMDTARGIGQTFGWEPRLFISQVLLFIIVALLMKKFAYGPVVQMLEERRRRIEQSMADAERIKKDLASAQAKAQELIAQANASANKLIEEARAAAARVQEQETQKAIAAAEQIIAKARDAAAADHARMLAELKREVGRLVVQTTATVTGKILSMDDQKRLAEETTKQIAA